MALCPSFRPWTLSLGCKVGMRMLWSLPASLSSSEHVMLGVLGTYQASHGESGMLDSGPTSWLRPHFTDQCFHLKVALPSRLGQCPRHWEAPESCPPLPRVLILPLGLLSLCPKSWLLSPFFTPSHPGPTPWTPDRWVVS